MEIFIMLTWVIIFPIIAQLWVARSPLYSELILELPITQPTKTHIHWFCCFHMDVLIDPPICGRIVHMWGFWWLWMAHILQGYTYWHCIILIDENCSQLRFSGWWHDFLYDLVDIQDLTIVGWEISIDQNKIMTSHPTSCLRFI